MKHFCLFLLALVASGEMALSHVTSGVTAPVDVGIRRWDNMATIKLKNGQAVEKNGIRFQTLVSPNELLIPADQYGDKTTVKFSVIVTNLSSATYRFDLFYMCPHIRAADGQKLAFNYARNATKNPEDVSDFPLLNPGENFTFNLNANLYWYADRKNSYLVLGGLDRSGGVWFFYPLKPGTYQVRFRYDSQESSVKLRRSGEIVEEIWTGKVSMPFADFRLVQSRPGRRRV